MSVILLTLAAIIQKEVGRLRLRAPSLSPFGSSQSALSRRYALRSTIARRF